MEWSLAHPMYDVEDIVEMADMVFGGEVEGILKKDRSIFRRNVTMASVYQQFDRSREFLAVARDGDKLLGFCWFDRGGYTTYSSEEISNAKFHHVDLGLSVRTRVRLIDAMIDQHLLWANQNGIPVVCSTSIRGDHKGFMKIHERRGFTVNGSYGWQRTEDGIRLIQARPLKKDE